MLNLIYLIFLIGIFRLAINRFHLLIILLRLELIIITLYFLLIIYLNLFNMELYFRIFFLVFRVCEGVLGLSILVLIIRFNGNDYFQALNLL